VESQKSISKSRKTSEATENSYQTVTKPVIKRTKTLQASSSGEAFIKHVKTTVIPPNKKAVAIS